MYRSVIVNELGEIIAYCSELKKTKIEKILEEHPEYRRNRRWQNVTQQKT